MEMLKEEKGLKEVEKAEVRKLVGFIIEQLRQYKNERFARLKKGTIVSADRNRFEYYYGIMVSASEEFLRVYEKEEKQRRKNEIIGHKATAIKNEFKRIQRDFLRPSKK
jgi:hypothetical protein